MRSNDFDSSNNLEIDIIVLAYVFLRYSLKHLCNNDLLYAWNEIVYFKTNNWHLNFLPVN